MFIIETYLSKSVINGNGVFAGRDIEKDEIVTIFDKKLDIIISEDTFSKLDIFRKNYLRKYTYLTNRGYILCADNERFLNHSNTPNLTSKENYDVSNTFIKKGTELTCNYYEFDLNADEKISFLLD